MKKEIRKNEFIKIISLICILIIADQFLKFIATTNSILINNNLISIGYYINNSITVFMKIFYIIITIILAMLLKKVNDKNKKNNNIILGLILILTGTIGNVIDMIIQGYIRDYIKIFNTMVMNISDVYITVGIIIIIGGIIKKYFNKNKVNGGKNGQ